MTAKITNYGATVTHLLVPDAKGIQKDVVLGYDTLDSFIQGGYYFGAICGRVANRIANGKFELDGEMYTLERNNGPNHLHGGVKGFDKVVWEGQHREGPEGASVVLKYTSADMEEGYPGNLCVIATYTLTNDQALMLHMEATSDKATPVNLTNHTYFNLAGHDSGTIYNQTLGIDASHYTPVDTTSIPTGELATVSGTPFDFTIPKPIGRDIQAAGGNPGFEGFDHNLVLARKSPDNALPLCAVAKDPSSGRVLSFYTDAPGVQLYTSNYVSNSKGKNGSLYQKHQAFCLEAQTFPDSVNQPSFPSCILRPGHSFRRTIIFAFNNKSVKSVL